MKIKSNLTLFGIVAASFFKFSDSLTQSFKKLRNLFSSKKKKNYQSYY